MRRLVVCPCLHSARRTFSQLSDHLGRGLVAPEWLYLEARFASLFPFEKVADLLGEILPVEDGLNAETVRTRLCRVGRLLDLVYRATFRTFVMKADPSLSKTVRRRTADLLGWLGSNADSLPCYRHRHQLGLPIASSPVESAVNQVVSRRMAKKLQLRWTKGGAQRLLAVRPEVLNGTLEDAFRRWYPRSRAAA